MVTGVRSEHEVKQGREKEKESEYTTAGVGNREQGKEEEGNEDTNL